MQYMRLDVAQREALLASLSDMVVYLGATLGRLRADEASAAGPDGMFSPVEQVWHLADLEREGFGRRIERLLAETEPALPDFDGTRIAAERNYRVLSLHTGLTAFAQARARNLETLRRVDPASWYRSGRQEGMGRVSLCDMPSFMFQHDAAHRAEIEAWKTYRHR